jgi:hypothetical protein
MKSMLSALLCSALLAACGAAPTVTPPPVLDVQTVKVDVAAPVACIDPSSVPARPDLLTDKQLLAGGGQQVVDQLWRDHIQQRDYIGLLEPIVQKCSSIDPPTPLAGQPIK